MIWYKQESREKEEEIELTFHFVNILWNLLFLQIERSEEIL